MPRISLTEQYDNKDVLTQIYRMLDQVATGTFQSVDVQRVGGDYVFTFTDQNGDPHSFTVGADYVADVNMTRVNGVYTFTFTYAGGTTESFAFTVNGVQNIASVQSGSTVTVTFTLDDGTTKTISYNAGGDMTTDTAQTVTAVKTFSVSPIVPDTPSGTHAAVNLTYVESTVPGTNNIVHKSGNEDIVGTKTFDTLRAFNNARVNRSPVYKPTVTGYYVFGSFATNDDEHTVCLNYYARGGNIGKVLITTKLSTSTITATPVYSIGTVPSFGLYTKDGVQYLAIYTAANNYVMTEGGTFCARGTNVSLPFSYLNTMEADTDYTQVAVS